MQSDPPETSTKYQALVKFERAQSRALFRDMLAETRNDYLRARPELPEEHQEVLSETIQQIGAVLERMQEQEQTESTANVTFCDPAELNAALRACCHVMETNRQNDHQSQAETQRELAHLEEIRKALVSLHWEEDPLNISPRKSD